MIKNSIIMKSFHSCQLQIMVLSHFQVVNLFNLKKNIYIFSSGFCGVALVNIRDSTVCHVK